MMQVKSPVCVVVFPSAFGNWESSKVVKLPLRKEEVGVNNIKKETCTLSRSVSSSLSSLFLVCQDEVLKKG